MAAKEGAIGAGAGLAIGTALAPFTGGVSLAALGAGLGGGLLGAYGGSLFGGGGPENVGGTTIGELRAQRESGAQGLRGSGFQAQAAFDAFLKYYGREPTEQELATAIPNFQGEGGFERGNAYVAQMAQVDAEQKKQEELNDPLKQAEQQRQQLLNATQQFIPTAHQIINSTLGREASDAEVNHFAALMAQGYDQYQIQEALTQTTEYQESRAKKQYEEQTKMATEARGKLRDELSTADTNFLTEKVSPALYAQYARMGRSAQDPGIAAALARQAGDLNTQREQYLAGLGYQDFSNASQNLYQNYQNNQGSQRQDYLNTLQRYYGNQDWQKNRSAQLSDQLTQRKYGLQDYYMQKNAYDQYMQNYGKRDWLDYANLALQGVGAVGNLYGAFNPRPINLGKV